LIESKLTRHSTSVTLKLERFGNFLIPHVEICVTKELKERICDLTKNVVGEATAVVVDCETVTKPIVREPLCARSCFTVSANDLEEANALAQRMRRGSNRACAPSF
jgi:preprotein translocase subunit SecD